MSDVSNESGCKVCAHGKVNEINAALAAGVSLGKICRDYGLSKTTLHHHKKAHVDVPRVVQDFRARRAIPAPAPAAAEPFPELGGGDSPAPPPPPAEVRRIQSAASRLGPVDDVAETLALAIQARAALGVVDRALIKTWLQAAELGIKTKLALESRSDSTVGEKLDAWTAALDAVSAVGPVECPECHHVFTPGPAAAPAQAVPLDDSLAFPSSDKVEIPPAEVEVHGEDPGDVSLPRLESVQEAKEPAPVKQPAPARLTTHERAVQMSPGAPELVEDILEEEEDGYHVDLESAVPWSPTGRAGRR